MLALSIEEDWTIDPVTNESNSSPLFNELTTHIADIIRESAHLLIRGQLEDVAGLILAQLAHVHGLVPISAIGKETPAQ